VALETVMAEEDREEGEEHPEEVEVEEEGAEASLV